MNQTKTGTLEQVESFYASLVSEFLKHPCVVTIEYSAKTIVLSAEPHPEDVGRLLGSGAGMFQAMMKLLRYKCAKHEAFSYYKVKNDQVRSYMKGVTNGLFRADDEPTGSC